MGSLSMRQLIIANVIWNAVFVGMMLSELVGVTAMHGALPWYLKWVWGIALASGNLVIHARMWVGMSVCWFDEYLDRSLADERERCARLVEGMAQNVTESQIEVFGLASFCRDIAKQIRKEP